MADTMNRRQVIAGTVVAGAITVAAVALPAAAAMEATKDPLTTLLERHHVLWEACPDDPSGLSEWNRSIEALADEMGRTAPTTKRGALAGLRHLEWFCETWAITDHEQRMMRNCIDFLAGEV